MEQELFSKVRHRFRINQIRFILYFTVFFSTSDVQNPAIFFCYFNTEGRLIVLQRGESNRMTISLPPSYLTPPQAVGEVKQDPPRVRGNSTRNLSQKIYSNVHIWLPVVHTCPVTTITLMSVQSCPTEIYCYCGSMANLRSRIQLLLDCNDSYPITQTALQRDNKSFGKKYLLSSELG